MFSTCVTVLCVKGLEAVAAVWPSILHDVALAAEGGLALVAAEVPHVPVPALCLSAFISKDYLRDPDNTSIRKDILHRDYKELNCRAWIWILTILFASLILLIDLSSS